MPITTCSFCRCHLLLASAAIVSLAATAAADDLFSLTATNGGTTITATDSDVVDLLEDGIETQGAFNSLSGTAVSGNLTYGGVANAIAFTINATETSATLSFPLTGFSRTFTGSDADDIEEQIEEFFEDDGAEEYAELLEILNQQSLVGVFDGNPFSSTAIFGRSIFRNFGIGMSGPTWANPDRYSYDSGRGGSYGWFSINPNFYQVEAGDDFEGYSGGVDASGGYMFNRTFGIAGGGVYQFNDIEDTEIYHSSAYVGLPINLIPSGDEVGLTLTPFLLSGFGGSTDAAAGGAFFGYGVASNLQLGLGPRVALNWGSQIIAYEGYDIEYDDYEFATDLDQTLVTTGLIATIYLDRPNGNLFIDGGATYNAYLEDAAVDNWIVPEVGLGWRIGGNSRVRAGYQALIGNADYDAHGVSVNIAFSY